MRLWGMMIGLQIIEVHSALQISVAVDNEDLPNAAVSIVQKCFASPDPWTTLLIISQFTTPKILRIMHQKFIVSSLIVSLNTIEGTEYAHPGICDDYSNTTVECESVKPHGVLVVIHDVMQLESSLKFYRINKRKLWNPRAHLLVVSERRCNVSECNNMFKVIWNYWILNAVILCSRNDPTSQQRSEFELYTFNPYSFDSSSKWQLLVNETVQLPLYPENFTHSWAIFGRSFARPRTFRECDDIYFDKTLNFGGYLIPTAMPVSASSALSLITGNEKWLELDWFLSDVTSKHLHYNVALIQYGLTSEEELINGTISFVTGPDSQNHSWFNSVKSVAAEHHPRFGSLYITATEGICYASCDAGPRPQWWNMADASDIWIVLGIFTLFAVAFLYLQNQSLGLWSAFLDFERLLVGSSVIHTSATIKYRIILGCILLAVLVIDGAIRGRLISTLTVVTSFPNLDTLQDLEQYNVKLYGHVGYKDSFISLQTKVSYVVENSIYKCMSDLGEQRYERACLTACRSFPFVTWNTSNVHVTSDPVIPIYLWSTRTLHVTMNDRALSFEETIKESGLVDEHRGDFYRASGVGSWKLRLTGNPLNVKPIKLNEMLLAFMVLCFGSAAALIAFTWETRGVWRCQLAFRCIGNKNIENEMGK